MTAKTAPARAPTDAEVCTAIVAATADAVIFADREGRIRLWNRGAELLFGYTAAEVLGASLDVIIPERLREAHWKGFDAALASGRTKYTDRVLTTRSMHKDGHKLYVDLGFGLVHDAAGNVAGAFATGRDCTARHAADVELRARVAALEAASAHSNAAGTRSV
ncbi:MAG TPA: PAS domain S-box protein [Casimicrobiaceae bacterium]